MDKKSYNEELVAMIKASGQELIDRAEDLVGNGEFITNLYISLRFLPDEAPMIEVTREHINKNAIAVNWPIIETV